MNMRKDGNCKMGKKLTVYFSASGVTRKAAEKVAKEHDTDLFEIRPVELYSDADLNWNNKNSRSSREMGDKSSRVEIADKMDNMADYDEIMQSPAMFARKFSMQTDPEIVKVIQAKIEEKNHAK